LWIARNDRPRFMEDIDRVLAFARRMDNAFLERQTNLNSAYFLYWRAEYDAGPAVRTPHDRHRRALLLARRIPARRAVLLARIQWGRGDEPEARKRWTTCAGTRPPPRRGQERAPAGPNDEMLLDMAALLVGGSASAEWEALMDAPARWPRARS